MSDCENSSNPIINRYQKLPEAEPDFIVIEGGRNDFNKGAVIGSVDEKDKTDAMRRHEEIADRDAKKAIRKPVIAWFVFAILTSLSCAVFPLLQVYFPTFFTIDLVIRIVFVVLATTAVAKLRQGIKVKGGLDFD